MAKVDWHTLLVEQIAMAPAVAAEMSRQLVSQAHALAGIVLDDGHHAFLPANGAFTVEVRDIGGATIASVDGDLVGPDAEGHPATLAWRSTTGGDPRLTPERGAGDLEFFWMTFPSEGLARPDRIEPRDWLARHRFGFTVELELHTLPGVWLRFAASRAFSDDQVAGLVTAIDGAIEAWNRRGATRVHYRGKPELAADRGTLSLYVDLGTGQLDALAEVLRAVDVSAVGRAVRACRVGA